LIDGWRKEDIYPPTDIFPKIWWGLKRLAFGAPDKGDSRALEYDQRVADAIVVLLNDAAALPIALDQLTQIKNDIIIERTARARSLYIRWALYLCGFFLLTTTALANMWTDENHRYASAVTPVWTAVAAGAMGAFFSIAIGLKNRQGVTIDLQKRENQVDVVLRMLIGAIAGGVFYVMLATELVTIKLFDPNQLDPARSYRELTVFMAGFVAGFLERLVPDLLAKTDFGTVDPKPRPTPTPAPTPTPTPTPTPATGSDGGAGAGGKPAAEDGAAGDVTDEDGCLTDSAPDTLVPTPDDALPVASGGVEAPPAAPTPPAPLTPSADAGSDSPAPVADTTEGN
jgi:hypothetical protein